MDEAAEDYAEHVATSPRSEQLDELDARTRSQLGHESMLSGPLVGRLLETLVAISTPRLVLEIGTFSGVSALMMAAGLPEGGRIITCEMDPEHAEFARAAFAQHPLGDRIELREGDAHDTIQALDEPLDFVFIDADKPGYPAYVDAILPKLAAGGLIVLDNMLLSGTVVEVEPGDLRAKTIDALNRRLASDPALVSVLLPVRDGVTLLRKVA